MNDYKKRLNFDDLTHDYTGRWEEFVSLYAPDLAPAFTKEAKSDGIRIDNRSFRIDRTFNTTGKWYWNDFEPVGRGATGLVMTFTGMTARELLARYNEDNGIGNLSEEERAEIRRRGAARAKKLKEEEAAKKRKAQAQAKTWLTGLWTHPGTVKPREPGFELVATYLRNRGIDPRYLPKDALFDVRANSNVSFNESKQGGKKGTSPAMIARLRDKNWQPASIHRTYLSRTGETKNLEMKKAKKLMPIAKDITGGGIWLGKPKPHLVIAEGIETTLSGLIGMHPRKDICGVAAYSASMLKNFDISLFSDVVREATIFADNDPEKICPNTGKNLGNPGLDAANQLAERLRNLGVTVTVKIPPNAGQDWNDCLQMLSVEEFQLLVTAS